MVFISFHAFKQHQHCSGINRVSHDYKQNPLFRLYSAVDDSSQNRNVQVSKRNRNTVYCRYKDLPLLLMVMKNTVCAITLFMPIECMKGNKNQGKQDASHYRVYTYKFHCKAAFSEI